MKLSEHLTKHRISQAAFARTIKELPQTVGRYVHGDRIPESEVMQKIAEATHGAVTANDFYGIEPFKRPQKAKP